MITLYLVRHCEYDNQRGILPGRLPVELSKKGIEQAHRLKKYFKDKNIDTIYSSPVLRCKQTSEIISNKKTPIRFELRLAEVLSAYQGYWKEDWNKFFAYADEMGGEKNKDVYDRVVDFYTNTKFESGKSYVICSHGDPLYFLFSYLTKKKILPDIQKGEEVITPDDYHPKGSVRIIQITQDKLVQTSKLLTF